MLFAGSQAGAKISQNWRIFISQDESFVKQLTINSFLIFNKTPKKITYNCGNNIKHEMVSGLFKI